MPLIVRSKVTKTVCRKQQLWKRGEPKRNQTEVLCLQDCPLPLGQSGSLANGTWRLGLIADIMNANGGTMLPVTSNDQRIGLGINTRKQDNLPPSLIE